MRHETDGGGLNTATRYRRSCSDTKKSPLPASPQLQQQTVSRHASSQPQQQPPAAARLVTKDSSTSRCPPITLWRCMNAAILPPPCPLPRCSYLVFVLPPVHFVSDSSLIISTIKYAHARRLTQGWVGGAPPAACRGCGMQSNRLKTPVLLHAVLNMQFIHIPYIVLHGVGMGG